MPNQGDPDGSARTVVRVNAGQQDICFELAVSGIVPATAATPTTRRPWAATALSPAFRS